MNENLFVLAKVVYRVKVDSILYNKQMIIDSMNDVYKELKDMKGFRYPDYNRTMKIFIDNTVIVHLYFEFVPGTSFQYLQNVITDRLKCNLEIDCSVTPIEIRK